MVRGTWPTVLPGCPWYDGLLLIATARSADAGRRTAVHDAGTLISELVVADHVSAELLGPGDLVRPWQPSSRTGLLPVDAVWTVQAANAAERAAAAGAVLAIVQRVNGGAPVPPDEPLLEAAGYHNPGEFYQGLPP